MKKELFTEENFKTLEKAREVYGTQRELGMVIEECAELTKELIRSARYDDFSDAVKDTREKVMEELADVYIVLNHVHSLYGITEEDLLPIVQYKLTRLKKWLNESASMEHTIYHREEKI